MAFWQALTSKISGFFSGNMSGLITTVSDSVDRFVTSPDERNKLKMELMKLQADQIQNERNFSLEMERLVQEREREIETTIRAELDAKKSIIVAELNQGDNYTKRARPTVIYAGLAFILMELFGIRHLILNQVGSPEIIASSDGIFKTFLVAWAGVVGVYSVGRSVEKRGTRTAWTSAITGSVQKTDQSVEAAIHQVVKEKIKW